MSASQGLRERRQREFEERECLLMDCASELIRQEGLLSLQMSRIAEKSEYAVGTLYKHFESKEDLLLALTARYTRAHTELFQRVAHWDACPRDRMFALGVADMIFVRRHPEYFRLAQYVLTEVVWQGSTVDRRQEFLAGNNPIAGIAISIVGAGVRAGDLVLPSMSAEELTSGFWALAMGIHNLVHAQGLLKHFKVRDPYRVLCQHLQAVLNGYGWKPLAALGDTAALDRLIERVCDEVFPDICRC